MNYEQVRVSNSLLFFYFYPTTYLNKIWKIHIQNNNATAIIIIIQQLFVLGNEKSGDLPIRI